jgi:hypothetical protein
MPCFGLGPGEVWVECGPRQFLGKSNYVLVSPKQRIVGTGKQGLERKNWAADPDRRRQHRKFNIAVKDIGEFRSSGMARRIVELQTDLATQVLALEDALQREKLLQTRVSLLRPSLLTGTLVNAVTVAEISK